MNMAAGKLTLLVGGPDVRPQAWVKPLSVELDAGIEFALWGKSKEVCHTISSHKTVILGTSNSLTAELYGVVNHGAESSFNPPESCQLQSFLTAVMAPYWKVFSLTDIKSQEDEKKNEQ